MALLRKRTDMMSVLFSSCLLIPYLQPEFIYEETKRKRTLRVCPLSFVYLLNSDVKCFLTEGIEHHAHIRNVQKRGSGPGHFAVTVNIVLLIRDMCEKDM